MAVLYSVGSDRFGGRLSSLINTLRIAEDYDFVPAVFWNRNHHTYPDLNDPELLFSSDFIQRFFLPRSFTRLGDLRGHDAAPEWLDQVVRPGVRQHLENRRRTHTPIMVRETMRRTLPWEDDAVVQDSYLRHARSVEFSSQANAVFDTVRHAVPDLDDAVGVHLRRGDIIRDPDIYAKYWGGRYIPDEYYMAAIGALIETQARVILFTDDESAKALYQDCFPELVVLDSLIDRKTMPAPLFDVAEMWTMAHCARIVAPTQSAFSQLASEISGTPILRLMDQLSREERDIAAKALKQRVSEGADGFLTDGDHMQAQLFLDRDPSLRPTAAR